MDEEEFERRCQCMRQLEGAEGGGGMRGWVEDTTAGAVPKRTQGEEASERRQQQRQHRVRSQVQQGEAFTNTKAPANVVSRHDQEAVSGYVFSI